MGSMKEIKQILPGTPKWESICEQCGLCCLVKCCDDFGNIFLTNVRCDMLNPETGKCECYSADMNSRETGMDSCAAHNGSALNMETLTGNYVVPSFCAYVRKLNNSHLSRKAAKRPSIDLKQTVPEIQVPLKEMEKHIIPNSDKYFRYNPSVNDLYHKAAKELVKPR